MFPPRGRCQLTDSCRVGRHGRPPYDLGFAATRRGLAASSSGRVTPMAIDVNVPRSRRAIIAGALAGLAATAAQALGRPGSAAATDGQPIVQGANNVGSLSTLIR